jgi:hypothetical protein
VRSEALAAADDDTYEALRESLEEQLEPYRTTAGIELPARTWVAAASG